MRYCAQEKKILAGMKEAPMKGGHDHTASANAGSRRGFFTSVTHTGSKMRKKHSLFHKGLLV
jgi:hypothetical protein